MAEVLFTQEEHSEIAAICRELDPARHELMGRHLEAFDAEARVEIVDYFRRALRSELVMGVIHAAIWLSGLDSSHHAAAVCSAQARFALRRSIPV